VQITVIIIGVLARSLRETLSWLVYIDNFCRLC
jgi:hypothetical protein